MVVEDEDLLLQAITKKIKISNMDVLSCSSGAQALDYLNNMEALPDAVWLDYYLKDMNGLAFMEELKSKPQWASIPVLVVSNSASPDKVSHMLALGVKKYILKAEYRLDEIIDMIRQLITEGPESDNAPVAQAMTIAPANNDDSQQAMPPSEPASPPVPAVTQDQNQPSAAPSEPVSPPPATDQPSDPPQPQP